MVCRLVGLCLGGEGFVVVVKVVVFGHGMSPSGICFSDLVCCSLDGVLGDSTVGDGLVFWLLDMIDYVGGGYCYWACG